MTNYAALGEYTAYSQQASDAANRRFAFMKNMANMLNRQAEQPDTVLDAALLQRSLDDITSAEREMRAAVERANQSAALCNKPIITLSSLSKF